MVRPTKALWESGGGLGARVHEWTAIPGRGRKARHKGEHQASDRHDAIDQLQLGLRARHCTSVATQFVGVYYALWRSK